MPFVKSKCPLPTRSLRLLRAAVWKCGFQPFSCPCSTYLPFVKSKSPLPTRNLRCLRAAAHSTSSALWLRHAHPSVAAAEKNLSHAEKQRVWSRSCGLEDLLRNIPISDGSMWPLWPLQNTEWFWRLSFHPGWVVGLPAFQLPMFPKCDVLPKGDLLDMFVSGVHSCQSFGKCQASTPYQKLKVAESGSTLH